MTTPTDADRIARRYPAPRFRRAWVPVALLLAAVGAVWLVWAGWHGANPPVSARVAAFEVTSDTSVDAVVTVQRPDPSVPVRCTILAHAVSYETVGQYPLEVAASARTLEDHRLTIRTIKRATTVSVDSCLPTP